MEHVNLGRSALRVSRLCLGTMNFGRPVGERESFTIMDRAREHGINFFDTANVYWDGRTEEIIGRWFSQGGRRREQTVVATKVYGQVGDGPNDGKLSALHIRRACEESLRRLRTDYIDLYQMHHVWREAPWEELWQALELLVSQGKVIYVGSSNFAGWHIAQANETARARNLLGLVSEQSLYNLTARTVELEVLPACQAYGVAVLPWSPLAGGLLGGVLDRPAGGRRDTERIAQSVERLRDRIESWEQLCKDLGESPARVALAWLLHNDAVTAPIVGPRTLEQLEDSLPALSLDLPAEVLDQLDEMFPGPGRPAPEAYAW